MCGTFFAGDLGSSRAGRGILTGSVGTFGWTGVGGLFGSTVGDEKLRVSSDDTRTIPGIW
jgi:hypothetical protein